MLKAPGGPVCRATAVIFSPFWFYKDALQIEWSMAVPNSEKSYFPKVT